MKEPSDAARREDEENPRFTDAFYNPRDQVPKTPRVYSYSIEDRDEPRDSGPHSRFGMIFSLCLACVILGLGLGTVHTRELQEADEATAESTAEVIATRAPAAPPTLVPDAAPSVTEKRGLYASAAQRTDGNGAFSASAFSDGGLARGEPYLGIVAQSVSPTVADYYNRCSEGSMVPGAQVYAIDERGCAFLSGVQKGDIIIRFGERDIASADELTAAKSEYRAGDSVTLTVYRDRDYTDIRLTLDGEPAEKEDTDSAFFRQFAAERKS